LKEVVHIVKIEGVCFSYCFNFTYRARLVAFLHKIWTDYLFLHY